MSTDHIVTSFDEELSQLSDLLNRMGGLAESQLENSIEALQKRDSSLAEDAIESDRRIDELHMEVDEMAIRLLALRQPMAGDLRHIVTALKVAPIVERIGDYSKNVAKRTIALNQMPAVKPIFTIPRMGRMVREMTKDVLDAFSNNDVAMAREVWTRDKEVDEMYDSLFRELLTYMMEDARNITACTHLLFVARNIERVGDLATNIAELIYYQVEGVALDEDRPKVDQASVTVVEPDGAPRRESP
ncbi:MAG: phosphate signaling complex protein PhoU [Rhodospirillaceae bacterium]|jgi:phosphate transport system protein|nr:phosphate signaling complex protein PhoU [Rhodospirillaceae bacterium]MBT5943964.1 phosphate signaling complex protein PhoU [Rhodospirillaceae bacterium]MBT6404069.1 phosphate signaling complex protein PhoU [Rhodospirillaceae bacterium]MBT6536990.1 phosphate signaling complex protein PhoU [Rhodospirillaceae bacterium]MBT7361307.1 phosphate signaling complex protein PhoU [Rhodospirillaceae bacterium]